MNEKIIDYLYGEMTPIEKQLFEKELQDDETLRSEVEDFQGLQSLMRAVEDEPVVVEKVIIQPERKRIQLRPWMALAASIALLATLFFALPIKVQKEGNQLMFSYGKVNEKAVENYINKADFDLALQNLKSDLIADLKPSMEGPELTSDVIQAELQQAFANWEQKQSQTTKTQMANYSEIQSDRMHEFFTQLVRYIDQQREKDAEMYTQTLQEAVRRMELNSTVASTADNQNL